MKVHRETTYDRGMTPNESTQIAIVSWTNLLKLGKNKLFCINTPGIKSRNLIFCCRVFDYRFTAIVRLLLFVINIRTLNRLIFALDFFPLAGNVSVG